MHEHQMRRQRPGKLVDRAGLVDRRHHHEDYSRVHCSMAPEGMIIVCECPGQNRSNCSRQSRSQSRPGGSSTSAKVSRASLATARLTLQPSARPMGSRFCSRAVAEFRRAQRSGSRPARRCSRRRSGRPWRPQPLPRTDRQKSQRSVAEQYRARHGIRHFEVAQVIGRVRAVERPVAELVQGKVMPLMRVVMGAEDEHAGAQALRRRRSRRYPDLRPARPIG